MRIRPGRLALLAFILPCALAPLACNDDSPPAADPAPFLGTWTVASSNLTLTCTGLAPAQTSVSGTVVVAQGSATPLRMTFGDSALAGCGLDLTLDGGTARVRGGQTCMIQYMGLPATFTIASGTLVPAGTTAALNLSGTAVGGIGNITFTCEGSLMGTLTRGAPDGGAPDADAPDAAAGDATLADTAAGGDAGSADVAAAGDAGPADAPAADAATDS